MSLLHEVTDRNELSVTSVEETQRTREDVQPHVMNEQPDFSEHRFAFRVYTQPVTAHSKRAVRRRQASAFTFLRQSRS